MKKWNIGYGLVLGLLAPTLVLMFAAAFSGCAVSERLDRLDGNPVYEIGKVGFHLKVKSEAASLMEDYLGRKPSAAPRLPILNLAWRHFWEGDNPFDRMAFDRWLEDQARELEADEVERQTLYAAAALLWQYLEVDAGGYVQVDDRSRRIVDSLVAGLRRGYRDWVSVNAPM